MPKTWSKRITNAQLPNGWDITRMARKFTGFTKHSNDTGWNSRHYHFVDMLFEQSPQLAEFYAAYRKVATKLMFNAFRSQCLNGMVIMTLAYMEAQHRSENDPRAPLNKSFNFWRHLFIRKFRGLRDHGKIDTHILKAMPDLICTTRGVGRGEFIYSNKIANRIEKRMHNVIYDRAERYQRLFRRQVLENKHIDQLDLSDQENTAEDVAKDKKKRADHAARKVQKSG